MMADTDTSASLKVNDVMSQAGWHLNALQFPPALHVCLTLVRCGHIAKRRLSSVPCPPA